MATLIIRPDGAPALGTVRALGRNDMIVVAPGAPERADWGRFLEAIGVAITRGASVVHQREARP
ncbi:hypothetical protein [Kitasatospora fiedleri]|uniref:hypothetical protein n=1 Tax=Kitasatospora fiedleri TaxID=2991545 RepID=UPI00249ACD40|nr:hypothetical protein [Kitasatospora fiedleri]